ncbi:MAG: hypothetical protein WCR55_02350 [Lentisphaerota bacterium]
MTKIVLGKLLSLVLLVVFLSSCSSTTAVDLAKIQKITSQEYSDLCSYSRRVISDFPESKISSSEKSVIYRTEPKFNVNYSSDKAGTYDLSWNVNGKTINYIGDGDLTKPKDSFSRIIIISTGITPAR